MTPIQAETVQWLLKARDFTNVRDILAADAIEMGSHVMVRLDYELDGVNAGEGKVFRYIETLVVDDEGQQLTAQSHGWTTYPDGRVEVMDHVTAHPDVLWS